MFLRVYLRAFSFKVNQAKHGYFRSTASGLNFLRTLISVSYTFLSHITTFTSLPSVVLILRCPPLRIPGLLNLISAISSLYTSKSFFFSSLLISSECLYVAILSVAAASATPPAMPARNGEITISPPRIPTIPETSPLHLFFIPIILLLVTHNI